jgi:hypothetical protein
MRRIDRRFPVAVLFLTGLALAATLPAAERAIAPVKLKNLTKAQIAALPDDQPVETPSGVQTKRQIKAKMASGKAQVAAKLAQAEAADQARFRQFAQQRMQRYRGDITAASQNAERALGDLKRKQPGPGAGALGPAAQGAASCIGPPSAEGTLGLFTPTATVVILGKCFGAAPGEVRLVGQFPGGALVLNPKQGEWFPGFIGAVIPSISAVPDQTVQVVVKTAAGKQSNEWTVNFKATRAVAIIIPGDKVEIHCGDASDSDDCDPSDGRTFDADHLNGLDVSSDDGWDSFSGGLKNGWVTVELKKHEASYELAGGLGGTSKIQQFYGYSDGATSFNVKIKWTVVPGSFLGYWVKIWAEGPQGLTPF